MSVASNIYAEKIFAEHPVAMWLLDDTADYHNLITEAKRNIPNNLDTDPETYVGWNIYYGTASDGNSDGLVPPFDSYITKITGDAFIVGETQHEITTLSPNIININGLDQSVGTVCVSTYIYSQIDTSLESISIGIEYVNPSTGLPTQIEKTYLNVSKNQWTLLSGTFDIPLATGQIRAFVSAKVNSGDPNYVYYLNGFSFGQLSEEFSATSLGAEAVSLPSDINISYPLKCVAATAYGLSEENGYYLLNGSILAAVNTSIPLVYGASNITSIKTNTYNDNVIPSLIIPGKGFLNKKGQYAEYTVEFWARINSDSSIPKKIFGPISSTDGLYVEDGFLTLVIGDSSASHFVSEWYRPMLISIKLIKNSATLVVNGEEVATLTFITDELNLPEEFTNQKSNDWLGFYGYDDVYPFEIDCVSIYSYQVPTLVSKRRFAYGQAVGSAENINSAFGGTTAFIDYTFANYAANYNYPDFARWEQGSFDNLTTSQNYLSTPEYSLPIIYTDNKSISELYADNLSVQNEDIPFITFRPNSSWDNKTTYLNFDKFNMLNSEVYGFCGVFKPITDSENNEILFKVYNKNNGNYFSVEKDVTGGQHTIDYYIMYNGERIELLSEPYTLGEIVSIGINIERLSQYYGGNVAAFFGNQNSLSMYVGGDETSNSSFTGNIYQVGFSTQQNATALVGACNLNGTFPLDKAEDVLAHTSSYTLIVENAHGNYGLDIGISGTWQDYLPLSYFAKYITDANGEKIYDLDFLQVNIGYPAISSLISIVEEGQWTYQQLYDAYNIVPRPTYEDLANPDYSGFTTYNNLKNNSETVYSYDTSNAFVKSYVTFQYISDGANISGNLFNTIKKAEQSRIIDISNSEYDLTWNTTRFEVVDNTIIYPRKDVDLNDVAIVYDIEINVRGILGKKIGINKFQVTSQALNHNLDNKVGTRFGVDMYPYKKSGFYYDYRGKNPFSIYKGSTPYLYLTRTSGIQIRGGIDSKNSRGLYIPINQNLAPQYSINALQMWMRYDDDRFSDTTEPLFEISYKTNAGEEDIIKFYIEANDKSNKRARIYALHNNGKNVYYDIVYYINGRYVDTPVISSKMWTSFGILFLTPLGYSSFSGKLSLTGNMVFNNVSYYKTNDIANIQKIIPRSWGKVIYEANPNYPTPADSNNSGGLDGEGWEYWTSFNWFDVYAEGSYQIAGFNPSTIYNAYIGTNKIVVDDSTGLSVNSSGIRSYSDVSYTRNVKIPV